MLYVQNVVIGSLLSKRRMEVATGRNCHPVIPRLAHSCAHCLTSP